MNLSKILIARKTRKYTDLDATEIAMAKKLGGGGSVDIVPFSTGTDEQVLAMIQASHGGYLDLQVDGGWAVGDVRTITVNAFTANDGHGDVAYAQQNIDIVITSFDDYNNCGCVLQFDFKDALAETAYIDYSVVVYENTKMYNNTLPALANALPSWISSNLITFDVECNKATSTSQGYTVSNNKLALRSVREITGDVYYAGGTQLNYYKTDANKIKKVGHNGSAGIWHTRSRSSGSFVGIAGSGGSTTYSRVKGGVAPFGCL